MYSEAPLKIDSEGLLGYSRFLSQHYRRPELFTPDYLRWQYAENPRGQAVGFDAFDGQTLVAHVATLPFNAVIEGKPEKGLLYVNAMTVPEHRRKGISVGLARKIEDFGRERGFSFMVGIANRNSTPSYIKGRGMELSTPLDVRICAGRPFRSSRPHPSPDFKVAWDDETLAWRLKRPGARYWSSRHGSMRTLYAPSGKPGIKVILGMFPEPSDVTFPQGGKPAAPLNLWIGRDPALSWKRTVHVPIPRKLRPSPLNFLFKDISGQKRTLADKTIFFQAIDFDAF